MGATENKELMQTAHAAWNSQDGKHGGQPPSRELSMIKRRFSLVVGATAALAIGGTHAFADAAAAQASSPDMQAEVSISGLPAIAGPTIDTGSLFDSAQQIARSALLGTIPGADVLQGLLGDSGALSPVLGSIVSNPTTAVATLTSDPVSTVTGLVGDPTGAVSSVRSAVASLDPTGVVGSGVNTVTSGLGSGTGSASAQVTPGSSQTKAQVNIDVPALPQASLPALPGLPAAGDVTSAVSNTLTSVTGTANGLLGSVTNSVPSISSINNVTGNLTSSLSAAANVCLQVVGCP
jgi:hypothetical protein